ncbi:conserved membrane hypothetical protein [Gammaproteobacteria bacterium]
MYKLLAVVLLSLTFSVSALGASTPTASNKENFNKNLAMVGGGVLGVVLASGLVGLASASTMMYEGAGFADAMESGTGLALPMAALSAILGAVFGQDMVLRNINSINSEPPPVAAH